MTTSTISQIVENRKRTGSKSVTVALAVAIVVLGAVFTGSHNYQLMARGIGPGGELIAFIPPITLEGSVLLLMFAQFAWFRDPRQHLVASVASWSFLGIIAANTVVNYDLNTAQAFPDWLNIYARFAVPATPIVGFAVWKLLIDLDPLKRRANQLAEAEEAEQEMMHNARLQARSGAASQSALARFQSLEDSNYANHILAHAAQPVASASTDADADVTDTGAQSLQVTRVPKAPTDRARRS